ncbi:TPA: anthranilate phosphoribosyltransferase [Candidatus Woesearchaeota archaeon]|nr:anthranilate phosphoribosyltransferase [Candidatus Woesearchaeota archaeon]
MKFKETIQKLIEKRDLTKEETEQAMLEIMEGKLSDAEIAEFLVALKEKGESIEEITACAKIMREKSVKIKVENCIDMCGTGGDKSNTFNISTAASFIVASAGITVAKHGNKSVSSKCGSADVLQELGVNINLAPKLVEQCINKIGIGFIFAPNFHPAMKYVANARKQLGVRTVFNILGPMTNPASPKAQVVGVFDANLTEVYATVLQNLGLERALVVNGSGLDEITLHDRTKITELREGKINTYYLTPKELGFKRQDLAEIKTDSVKENAEIIRNILDGKNCPHTNFAVVNTAAGIYVAGKASSIKEGIEIARQSIASGKAREKLMQLRDFTNINSTS